MLCIFRLQISRKRWLIEHTLHLLSSRKSAVAFRLAYLYLTLTNYASEKSRSFNIRFRKIRKLRHVVLRLLSMLYYAPCQRLCCNFFVSINTWHKHLPINNPCEKKVAFNSWYSCYSILHFAVCQLLRWAFLFLFVIICEIITYELAYAFDSNFYF